MTDIRLTRKVLAQLNACLDGIVFAKRNNLLGFPLNRVSEVDGDYIGFIEWVSRIGNIVLNENGDIVSYTSGESRMTNEYEFLDNGNTIMVVTNNTLGWVRKYEYDSNLNNLSTKMPAPGRPDIILFSHEYDQNNNLIYTKHRSHYEEWYEYDDNSNLIKYRDSDGNAATRVVTDYVTSMVFSYIDKLTVTDYLDDHGNTYAFNESTGYAHSYPVKYYDDGQLKQLDTLKIPFFEK